jgi:glycosyltransferase involved in cell wall biosynthesis
MGRLVEQKGLSDLVAAVANLEGSIGLDVAGEGPYRSVLERQIDDLGLADRVRMHGWVDPARCVDLLQGARALVVPSVAPETAGAVVIESAAQGRAVIASDIGGLPEYAWDEETAIVVPPGDVAALTNAIGRLAGDWTLADRMGRRGYEVARKVFSIENHLDRLHDLYVRSIREQNVRQATHMSLPG